jgi:hypothetical protein
MDTRKSNKVSVPPQHGWINDLARLADCSRETVRTAIFDGRRGMKSEKVRQLYRAKYVNQ